MVFFFDFALIRALFIVDFAKKSITKYDSLHASSLSTARYILNYVKCEFECVFEKEFDVASWTLTCGYSPSQMDGNSCGVFTCLNALYLCQVVENSFGQSEADAFRNKMAFDLGLLCSS